MPIVLIDQDTDPDATIVQLSFGDRLGALLDMMKARNDLGLVVLKGTVTTENSLTQTKFFITRLSTERKVEDPDVLERIHLTIINNLLKYHPAWTNGRLYSAHHRVMMKGSVARYSIGLFSVPKEGYIIKAPEEMVDEEHPLLFKPYDHFEFVDFFYSPEGLRSADALKAYCGV